MMKLNRSAFVVAVLALGAVGCGDDVTDAGPIPPPPLSATFTPSSQTINVGGTADFAVGITGGEGTAAWTCTSSGAAATVVVIETGCRVKAVSAGSVTITASVTKGTSKFNVAGALLINAVVSTPATVLISAINQGAGGPPGSSTIGTPANLLITGGQVDVVLNIERGTQVLNKVELLLGTVVVSAQTFAAAVAGAENGPDQQAIQQITLSFDSKCYTSGTAGAACGTVATAGTAKVRHMNGDHKVSAKLTLSDGATSLVSANSVMLVLGNVSGFHLASVTLPTVSALSSSGLTWYGGPASATNFTRFTAVPVVYGTGAVSSVTATFCAASVTVTTAPFTFTFANAVSTDKCWAFSDVAAGTTPALAWVIDGNAGPVGAPLNTSVFPVRIDNVAPTSPPTFIGNPNLRENGWINGAVNLVGLNEAPPDVTTTTATPDGWLVKGADCTGCAAGVKDAGIGGYVLRIRVGASTLGGDVTTALAATPSATPVFPAASTSNTDYCGIASATDLLGNETALPAALAACSTIATPLLSQVATAATSIQFGVDTTVPTIAFCIETASATQTTAAVAANCTASGGPGLTADKRVKTASIANGLPDGEFRVTVADVGGAGNSGMLSSSAVRGTIRIARPGLAIGCVDLVTGAVTVPLTCAAASLNAAPAFPDVATNVMNGNLGFAASTTTGFVFFNAFAQDAAGNQSAAITRMIVHDATVPTATTSGYNTPLSSGSVVFSATGADELDLRDVKYTLAYTTGGFAYPFLFPKTTLHALPSSSAGPEAVTFVKTGVASAFTVANFIRQVQPVTSTADPLTVSGAFTPVTVTPYLRDQTNTNVVTPTTTLTGNVTTGVSYLASLAPQLVSTFLLTAAPSVSSACGTASCVSTGDAVTGSTPVVASYPTSVVLDAVVSGPTASFTAPFARVDFYTKVVTSSTFGSVGTVLELIGSSTQAVTTDTGAALGRSHKYSLTWTPAVSSPMSATAWLSVSATAVANTGTSTRDIYAVGINAAGDALVTAVNSTVTIARP
ncbi:MAG: hypothetical protein EXR92_03435 [Gemmatimonadetes bacterium]|nr:hypothetical protein [Gemmatimonadota bacterium]